MFNKPTYKQLKELLVSANESANFFAEKCHELENLLEVETDKANFFKTRTEYLEKQTDDKLYFRMSKISFNKMLKNEQDLQNKIISLKEEIEQNKQNVVNYTINLDTSSIDVHELTRKVI